MANISVSFAHSDFASLFNSNLSFDIVIVDCITPLLFPYMGMDSMRTYFLSCSKN